MHKFLSVFVVLMASLLANAAPADLPTREIVQLNRAWTFTLGDPKGAEAVAFVEKDWQRANLPHSFSIPYFLGSGFYVGYGWYRKNIDLPEAWKEKQVSLEFDGVFQEAEIYVNGKPAGRHKGGYTGFSIDISPYAKPGANTIAVRVNNLWNAQLAPRAGEHVFAGGIYRDVRLVATNPVHVTWYGTYVTTPSVSAQRATIAIQTEVRNSSAGEKSVALISKVVDAAGRLVTQVRTDRAAPAGALVVFEQKPPAIDHPSLWGPGNPALYTLKSEVYLDGKMVDSFATRFGIRSIKWTADRGFFLNGKHLYLRGANVHQDHAGWGDAVTHAGSRRDVQMIKDAGFNFIRGSHYPHSPAFSKATDELGMLSWVEAPFWGIGGFGLDGNWLSSAYPPNPADRKGFEDSVLAQSAEMIRIHRNHPSVVVWSNGNETFFSDKTSFDALRAFTRRQVDFMRSQDRSRPVAIGGAQRGEIDRLGDIAGYNGDGAALFLNPGVPNIVSEYGSTIADRPGKYEPGWGNLTEPPDQKNSKAKYPWRYQWRSGEVIWAGFDHGSIAAIEFGSMGMIDYFRIPKRQYYWYRNEYTQLAPPAWPVEGIASALALTADKSTITGTQGHDDVQLLVQVRDSAGRALSNSPEVTLTIESGPGEFPTGRSITFNNKSLVAIRDGQAAISFRSYHAGTSVIRATSPGLAPARIDITTTGPDPYIAAESPVAPARPVLAFPPFVKVSAGSALENVIVNRPTAASSAAPGHSSRMANDGDQASYWQAATNGAGATWSVDLENIYNVRGVEFAPQAPDEIAFVVEGSLDGTAWHLVGEGKGAQASYTLADFAPPIKARSLRVRFTAIPNGRAASIKELRVLAVPATR
jgi:beta-galactosidase